MPAGFREPSPVRAGWSILLRRSRPPDTRVHPPMILRTRPTHKIAVFMISLDAELRKRAEAIMKTAILARVWRADSRAAPQEPARLGRRLRAWLVPTVGSRTICSPAREVRRTLAGSLAYGRPVTR